MEVAEEIGISQAQVSRLEKSAIKQMNKTIQDKVSPFMVKPFMSYSLFALIVGELCSYNENNMRLARGCFLFI